MAQIRNQLAVWGYGPGVNQIPTLGFWADFSGGPFGLLLDRSPRAYLEDRSPEAALLDRSPRAVLEG